MRYADFLMQPYAKEISMRKIRIKSKNKNEPRILQKNFKELFEKFQTAFDPQKQLYIHNTKDFFFTPKKCIIICIFFLKRTREANLGVSSRYQFVNQGLL